MSDLNQIYEKSQDHRNQSISEYSMTSTLSYSLLLDNISQSTLISTILSNSLGMRTDYNIISHQMSHYNTGDNRS